MTDYTDDEIARLAKPADVEMAKRIARLDRDERWYRVLAALGFAVVVAGVAYMVLS